MKTIVVPTRFNQSSENAVIAGASLARKTGATLILMHVLASLKPNLTEARQQLDKLKNSEKLLGVNVQTTIVDGLLTDHLHDDTPDLIVIGAHEMTGIMDTLFKKNTAKEIRTHAHCPVITVKSPTDLGNINRIIFPTDMRGEQRQIIEDVKEFQAIFKAHVHLIKSYGNQILKSADIEKRLIEFAEKNGLIDYSVTARFNMDESAEILKFAKERKADIIVMATHDRLGIERLLTGFVSSKVIKGSDTAVWTKLIY